MRCSGPGARLRGLGRLFDEITTARLQETLTIRGWTTTTLGSLLLRLIYHYWYHIGEIMSIRQQLGHGSLPDFVGNIDEEAPYRQSVVAK